MPPSTKTFIFHYAQSQPMNNIGSINGWSCWKVMKFGHNHMSRFRLNLGHLCVVGLKNWMENYNRYKNVFWHNHRLSVPPFSHNVVFKRNTTIGWIFEMANVSTKNNGAWHTILVALIKLVGVLDLTIIKHLPWHSTRSWWPHGIGNGVY
jgi:hypothetical protein